MGGGECRKCGCQKFRWDPLSAVKKLGDVLSQNDGNDEAFRNCLCGHHFNYHDE
jgi:hypothetical protein